MGTNYFSLHPGQWEVFHSPAKFRYLVCGRGWGKDHLAIAVIMDAIGRAGPGFRVTYIGPSHNSIRDIAWDRLKSFVPRSFLASDPHETRLEMQFRWGPLLTLRGSDRLSSRRGPDNNLVVITEFAFCRPETWMTIKPTLRRPQDKALLITTPHGPNHAWELWQEAQNRKLWATWQRPTWDNPGHDAEAIEEDRETWARTAFEQEYGAKFEALTGAVYCDFSLEQNSPPGVECDPSLPLYIGQDFNAGHYCAILVQKRGDALYVVDEVVTRTTIYDHIGKLIEYCKARGIDHRTRCTVFTDSSGDFQAVGRRAGPNDAELFRRESFLVKHDPQNPPIIDRVHAVQALLLSASGKRRLFVSQRCHDLKKALLNQRWSEWGESKPEKRNGWDDLTDALGYAVWGIEPLRAARVSTIKVF